MRDRPMRAAGLLCLAALLGVDDPGRAVGEQAEGEVPGADAGVADGVEVGQPVDDHQVGDPQAPGTVSTAIASGPSSAGCAHQPPRLVVDHPALTAGRVGQGGFHPRRRAGHHQGDQRVRA